MSKNVAILEGQTAKTFANVKKIQLSDGSGSSNYWVPEDETRLITKHINKNGTYKASEEEGHPYGYSQVTVSGIGKASGIDPETGEDAVVEPDPTTNELTKKILPSKIGFANPPSKRTYEDGETITIVNAVIRAYKKNGGDWSDADHPSGIIPHNELTLDPSVADISKGGRKGRSSDLNTNLPQPITTVTRCSWKADGRNYPHYWTTVYEYTITNGVIIASKTTANTKDWIFATDDPENCEYVHTRKTYFDGSQEPRDVHEERRVPNTYTYTYNGKTVYYHTTGSSILDPYDEIGFDYSNINVRQGEYVNANAWTMVYGEPDGGQDITVKWNRPEDGKELTTEFEIAVIPSQNDGGS